MLKSQYFLYFRFMHFYIHSWRQDSFWTINHFCKMWQAVFYLDSPFPLPFSLPFQRPMDHFAKLSITSTVQQGTDLWVCKQTCTLFLDATGLLIPPISAALHKYPFWTAALVKFRENEEYSNQPECLWISICQQFRHHLCIILLQKAQIEGLPCHLYPRRYDTYDKDYVFASKLLSVYIMFPAIYQDKNWALKTHSF